MGKIIIGVFVMFGIALLWEMIYAYLRYYSLNFKNFYIILRR